MKKLFIVKCKSSHILYQIDLSIYSIDIDYKLILRLLIRDKNNLFKHNNFISSSVSQKTAFNLISYFLKCHFSESFEFQRHYNYCYKEIGPVGIDILTHSLLESIESVVYSEPQIFDLNNYKIQ